MKTSLLRQWAVSVLARVWCSVTAGGVMSCSAPAGLVSGEHCCGAVADEPATAQQQYSWKRTFTKFYNHGDGPYTRAIGHKVIRDRQVSIDF